MKYLSSNQDLTQGSVLKKLIAFALPFFFSSLLQSLYGALDLFVIGLYSSPSSVAAISTGTQVTQIITSILTGFTIGTTVLVADAFGKKKEQDIPNIYATSLWLFFIIGIVLTLLFFIFTPSLLRILDTPIESFSNTKTYVYVCSVGILFIGFYNCASGVLRGLGDSLSPFYVVIFTTILNAVLDFVFVAYFKLDVFGVALATVLAQFTSMICSFYFLKVKGIILQNLCLHKHIMKEMIALSLPITIQEALTRTSFLYLSKAMNSISLQSAAVVGISAKYDVFAMLTGTSFASAITAFTAQNMASNQPKRAYHSVLIGSGIALTIASIFFLCAQIAPNKMMEVFTHDHEIIKAGIQFLKTCSYDYLFVSILFCMNGYLNGCKKTMWTLYSEIFQALGLRIPFIYLIHTYYPGNLNMLGRIAPTVSLLALIYTTIYIQRNQHKTL